MEKDIKTLFDELETAKENVRTLLNDGYARVDMHDIVYWAERVKVLRDSITDRL